MDFWKVYLYAQNSLKESWFICGEILHKLDMAAVPSVSSFPHSTYCHNFTPTHPQILLEYTLLEGISTSAKQFKGKLVHMQRDIA
jgi:hypothetical protein